MPSSGELDPPITRREDLRGNTSTQPDIPDPDLLIRTGGESRVSNFLLWQIAYTEILTLDLMWPDFREEHLEASDSPSIEIIASAASA